MIRFARGAIAAGIATVVVLLPAGPVHADQARDRQWHLGTLRIAEAQQLSLGQGVTVAVVDTGIDPSHPDLSRNVLAGKDFFEAGGDGRKDEGGHGTAMAGLIAAHGRSGNGVLGIAPQAKVLPLRTGVSEFSFGDIEGAIAHAVQMGAKVICIAITGGAGREMEKVIADAVAADVVVVAAAGNTPRHQDVGFPAAYPGVVAAVATDRAGNHADVSVTGSKAVLAAPGVEMYTTGPNRGYATNTGTSSSTAVLAGVAALIRSKYPQLSATEVIRRMTATAVDKGTTGRDPVYGFGLVDPVAALTKELPPSAAAPTRTASSDPPVGAAPKSDDGNRGAVLAMVVGASLLLVALLVGAFVLITRRRRT